MNTNQAFMKVYMTAWDLIHSYRPMVDSKNAIERMDSALAEASEAYYEAVKKERERRASCESVDLNRLDRGL